MENYIKYAEKLGASYTELNSVKLQRNNLEIQNKDVKDASFNESKLYSVRVLYKGAFAIAYSPKPEFKELIKRAIKTANILSKEGGIKIDFFPSVKRRFEIKPKINPLDISLEQKKNDLLKFKNQEKIIMLHSIYSDSLKEHLFVNSENRYLEFKDVKTAFMCFAHAKEGNKQENYYKFKRILGGYELMKDVPNLVNEAMKNAREMLNAVYARGGNFPIIVNQNLAGVFAHEAVGHCCEADLVLTNTSILKDKINQKIAVDNLTIIDDSLTREWGYTPFDSEGVVGQRTVLIENGTLKNYLHTRETASIFKVEPTGNGRAMSLANKPIPRMTNTIIKKGNSNFDEMLAETKNGYYLIGSSGGQVNTLTGEFLFNAREGYSIENHELTKRVKNVSLVGNILEILPKIELIGKEQGIDPGWCGKNEQYVNVCEIAPHLKIGLAKVGGQK